MSQSKRELLIFDLDDTLLDTSDLYYKCRQEFISFLGTRGNLSNLIQIFENHDAQNIELLGYAPWRYSYTMAEIYLALARDRHLTFSAEDLIRVVNIGRKVEQSIPEPRPGAKKTLRVLSSTHKLAILTRGDPSLQLRKLQHHRLDRFFAYISVVDQKSVEAFEHVLIATSSEPEMAWSIGDSPKWDILPAQRAGLRTILVNYEHSDYVWNHEERGLRTLANTLLVHDLSEVPSLITKANDG